MQKLPITLEEAWHFFSSPHNLEKITPADIKFKIHYTSGDKIYAGQIIHYTIQLFPGIKTRWTTEITHVRKQHYFIDEQRFGPYAFWHHQHKFEAFNGSVEMTDEVNYAIPLGIVGRFAHWLFVGRMLNRIFDYRYKILEELFSKSSAT